MSTQSEISRAIEAILMVADQPVAPRQLAEVIGADLDAVEIAAAALIQTYADDDRGFVLQRVAGGLRLQSHPDMAPVVERFVLDGQASRLSAAALETMAIIAYKQPISRNQISAIRGVNAEGVVRTLEARGYVAEIARDPGPGRASLYGTTSMFLERLGLNSVDELPPLGQFVPSADVVEALETTLLVGDEIPNEALDTAGDEASVFESVSTNGVGPDDYAEDLADSDSDGDSSGATSEEA